MYKQARDKISNKLVPWYGKLTSKTRRMESSSSLCDLFPAREKTIMFAVSKWYGETDVETTVLLFN